MNAMTALVAGAPIGYPVGKLVEQWVTGALTKWHLNVPDRSRSSDGSLRLLAWDLVDSSLAYADWDCLVTLLSGGTVTSENLFTWSLYRSIMNDSHLHQPVGVLISDAPNAYVCADTLKDWFEAQINAWIDAPAVRRQHNAAVSVVVYNLIQNTYTVINWEHVARAFQPGY